LSRNRPCFSLERSCELRIGPRGRRAVLTDRIDHHRVAIGKREIGSESGIRSNVVASPPGSIAAARSKREESGETKLRDVQ
jgi:hypothetical protein